MREILFRGKTTNTKDWAYGYYYETKVWDGETGHFIHSIEGGEPTDYPVIPETVGQYTGLKDKNGVRIFEGDMVTYPDGDGGYEYCDLIISSGVVMWADASACFYATNNYSAEFPDTWDCIDEIEVIGNIHDNPELGGDNT